MSQTAQTASLPSEPWPGPHANPRELSAEELRFTTKIKGSFTSTRELTGAKEFPICFPLSSTCAFGGVELMEIVAEEEAVTSL